MAHDYIGSKEDFAFPMFGYDSVSGERRAVKVTPAGKLQVDASISASSLVFVEKNEQQNLSADSLTLTTAFAREWCLDHINLKAASAITQTVTVVKKSKNGTAYDTDIYTYDIVAGQSFFFNEPIRFRNGDEIEVTCTNTGTPAIVVSAELVGYEV